MHLPIWSWRNTLARLGVRVQRGGKKPAKRRSRSLLIEFLEPRQLLTIPPAPGVALTQDTGISAADMITSIAC